MFYLRFKNFFIEKEQIAHFRSVPLFWWAMWVNRSFRSNKMSDVSELLRSLTKNERTWVICSGCSEEMSHPERISQVAHQKWENEWITHFFERITHFFERITHWLIFGQKNEQFARQSNEWIPSPAIELISDFELIMYRTFFLFVQ